MAYEGAAARIDITGYTVGASNAKPGGSAIDSVNAPAKTRKVIENGQIVLIKNGVRYNMLGTEIK